MIAIESLFDCRRRRETPSRFLLLIFTYHLVAGSDSSMCLIG
jgi:hypothetical protein